MSTIEISSVADLRRLFDPRSVVVVGASATPGKWGYEYSRRLLMGRGRREVHLVNERGAVVHGVATYRSVEDVPGIPELALICVPRAAVLDAVDAILAKGCRLIVCITAGFAETGAEGAAIQAEMMRRIRRAGARLVGPNCLGLYDASAEFQCTSFWDIVPGRVGIVSQSGTVLLELAARLGDAQIGISRAVSLGNQADIGIEEYVDLFVDHTQTEVLVVYVEEFRDGRAVLAACKRVRDSGKPVILLVPSATDAVMRAVSSHTGSLVAPDTIVDEACADLGLLRVSSTADLFLALHGLVAPVRLSRRRVAIVADGGGAATMAASAASSGGLEVPAFSGALVEKLKTVSPPGCGLSNPVDVVGALDLEVFTPILDCIARSGEVDGIILSGFLNNVLREDTPEATAREQEIGRALARTVSDRDVALAIASVYPAEPGLRAMAGIGVPLFDFPEQATRALLLGSRSKPLRPMPELPKRQGREPVDGYFAARRLFQKAGVVFAPAKEVATLDEALRAARELGYPVVLKALASSHKSDGGGVAVGLQDEVALKTAFKRMASDLAAPSYSVEAMADLSGGVEMLVGALRDRSFGPTIAVGIGGTLTELIRDSVVALAPIDEAGALEMVKRLRFAPLLDGYRGRPPVDRQALARVIAAVSRLVAARPDIVEAELNPVFVTAQGVVAVDARVVTEPMPALDLMAPATQREPDHVH